MREIKGYPGIITTKDIDLKNRIVVGICSVFGNVDDIGDRVHPGAFAKTINEGRNRAKHLWQHNFGQPPTASILPDGLQEVGREALPAKIQAWAPDATGGLEVRRKYYERIELSEWVFTGIVNGDITEMSFGFDAKKYDWTEEGEGIDERRIRNLREMKLYDTSDVLWGMNPVTMADAKGILPLDQIASNLTAFFNAVKDGKAGRRNAESDLELINAIHNMTNSLGATVCQGIVTEDEAGNAETESGKTSAIISLSQDRRTLDELTLAGIR